MPRDRRAFDDATRAHGVRDRALARAAGEDEDDASESTADAFSARLRMQWRGLSVAERQQWLRADVAAKFLRRFGVAWNDRRRTLFAS